MADWIRKGERITVVSFARVFNYEDSPGSGFGFPCTEDGVPINDEYVETWTPNYIACLTGVVDGRRMIDRGIERREHSYWEPGVLRCQTCGGEVVIEMLMTNTCDNCRACGQPKDFGWHLLTVEQCEAYMQLHEGRSCANPVEHHEFDVCFTDYNHSGQRLAPREQWGEDTGESVSDILMADTRLT